ncbi:MAG: C4-dicarboxylate ABC transporter permease [Firmicutes bacterium]|nr:C4-dicarboxylate ABC transporter permease [Bacillota bacterium]MTI83154.1 C4-dicarboxylate ABC transporter permease [Bacillota bacterium]
MPADFIAALSNIAQPTNFLIMAIGVGFGIIVGALPGLTATMAMALLVPFTFTMDAVPALMTLGGIYVGAIYGGCIAAILVNTPGTPSAIATTFDGFPLTKKGKAEHALVTAAFSSAVGGVIGAVVLLLLSPPLASIALKFGPPEYFWLSIFGLTIIATLASGSMLKGLIGGGIGLLLSQIGIAPLGGEMRFTFGLYQLQAGLSLIVVLIGFFCIPEVLSMIEKKFSQHDSINYKPQKGIAKGIISDLIKKPILLLRSAVIGAFVGIVPGAGGNIAGLVSYNEAVRWSKKPKEFGKGNIDGVAASEAANNAEVGGSLVPLMTLGIPGAAPAAILLGALMLQGMRPGPELYINYGDITYTFLFSLIVANIVMGVMAFYGARHVAKLINLPVSYLAPMVVFMTVIGSYAIRNNITDVIIMILFGLVGYVTKKAGFHPGPIVLGLILGPIAENGLVQSMLMGKSAGSMFEVFFTRPLSIILIILCLVSAGWPLISNLRNKTPDKEADANA